MLQNTFRQQLEMEHDAALHRQQLEADRLNHALRLAKEADTTAQTHAERLKTKHDQEVELSEVRLRPQSTFLDSCPAQKPSNRAEPKHIGGSPLVSKTCTNHTARWFQSG